MWGRTLIFRDDWKSLGVGIPTEIGWSLGLGIG